MDAVLRALGALPWLGLMAATAGETAVLDRWTLDRVRAPQEPPRPSPAPVVAGAGRVHG